MEKKILTTDEYRTYVRSMAQLMMAAAEEVSGGDPDYRVQVHFVVSDGLYCTLNKRELADDAFLEKVQRRMHQIQEEGGTFVRKSMRTADAAAYFREKGILDKSRLLHYRRASVTNVYQMGSYMDYSYGRVASKMALLGEFALTRYEGGFVLRFGTKEDAHHLPLFEPDKKLFAVQKDSLEWGERLGIRNVADLNGRIVSDQAGELILTMEAYHEREIAHIAASIAADPQKRIVMIAGPSSSGKTTFSHRLSAQLSVYGLRPHPIPVDDYFKNREDTPRDEHGEYNFECLEALDVEQFNTDMTRLLAGEQVELPTFNFKAGKREYRGKVKQLGERDILVIEGIHCLNDALSYALPRESMCKIYISALTQLNLDDHNRIATTDGRLIRRIVRDARTRGTSAERTIRMWPSVRRGEEQYIFPHQESADIMFNSALIYELSVLKVYVEPYLFGISQDMPEYVEAKRLLKFLEYFVPMPSEAIPNNSLLREFVGGGCFEL